jgi:hypothetical protein
MIERERMAASTFAIMCGDPRPTVSSSGTVVVISMAAFQVGGEERAVHHDPSDQPTSLGPGNAATEADRAASSTTLGPSTSLHGRCRPRGCRR